MDWHCVRHVAALRGRRRCRLSTLHNPLRPMVALFLAGMTASCWSSPESPEPSRTRITRETHTEFFPLDTSSSHSESTCNDCHGGLPSFLEFICISCHEHAEALMDAAHGRVVEYAFDSGACYECHPTGTVESVEHEEIFPIAPSTPHGPLFCSECHTTPGDRKHFICGECHDHRAEVLDPPHAAEADYSRESNACYECHPDGRVESVEHEEKFPIAEGSVHGSLYCSECHTVPGNRQEFICGECHDHRATLTDPAHDAVSDYDRDAPYCLHCHQYSDVTTRAGHDPFFPLVRGDHNQTACTECHIPFTELPRFECIQCHEHTCAEMNDEHDDVEDYACTSAGCFDCHPRGEE